jgi:hypothetical protein
LIGFRQTSIDRGFDAERLTIHRPMRKANATTGFSSGNRAAVVGWVSSSMNGIAFTRSGGGRAA